MKNNLPKLKKTETFVMDPASKPPKEQFYVDPKEFYKQIKEYYKSGEINDYLAEAIYKIAKGLSYAPNFINYSYRDDMVGDAVVKMYTALKNKKFNVKTKDKNGYNYNPFSYFTTIAFHAFITRIKKEKKEKDTIALYQEFQYREAMQALPNGDYVYIDPDKEDNYNEY
jgi:DNA-directed RNA polymerase specialized sigma24 family protein